MKSNNKKILEFCKKISQNAPLSFSENIREEILNENPELEPTFIVKYPYKYFLILSIILVHENENIFDTKINLKDVRIVKKFYDFVTSDYFLFEILKNHTSKKYWELGLNEKTFNNKLFSSVFQIMKESPVKHITNSTLASFNKKTSEFTINIKSNDYLSDTLFLKNFCLNSIRTCLPWNKNVSDENILNTQYFLKIEILNNNKISDVKKRKYQHIFRKLVMDRDIKCNVCSIETSSILEACHLKPYSMCKDEIEKYNPNNGIVLCKNHHKLFDCGLFSFDQNWNVLISNELSDSEINLLFHKYNNKINNINLDLNNIFIDWHRNNIFKKN